MHISSVDVWLFCGNVFLISRDVWLCVEIQGPTAGIHSPFEEMHISFVDYGSFVGIHIPLAEMEGSFVEMCFSRAQMYGSFGEKQDCFVKM